MSADGSGARRLTNHPAWERRSRLVARLTAITFESDRDDSHVAICIVNADGFLLAKTA